MDFRYDRQSYGDAAIGWEQVFKENNIYRTKAKITAAQCYNGGK